MTLVAIASLLLAAGQTKDVDADVKAVQAVAKQFYAASKNFLSDHEATLELAARFKETAEWRNGLVTKYADDIKANNAAGRKIATVVRYFNEQVRHFVAAKDEFGKNFKKDFDGLLAKADTDMDRAIQLKGPGIATAAKGHLVKADAMVGILAGFNGPDHDSVKTYRAKLDEARARMAAKDEQLRAATVRVVEPPGDGYSGADKESLRASVREAWAKEYPKDEILFVRMHASGWNRTNKATWDKGSRSWGFSDMSVLPVRVVVRKNETTATLYTAYVNKDNLGGAVVIGVRTKGPEYVIEDIEIARLKP